MNVEWNVLTYNQQEALRHFSSGQRHQVRRETEEQLRNLGLAEHDGVGAKISKIGLHLLQSHQLRRDLERCGREHRGVFKPI